MKLFGAIDLHSNNNVTVLINEKDEVVYRKRLPNDLKLILGQLAPHQSTIKGIVVESTYNWYWLVDGLMGREVIEFIWPTPRPLNNTVDSNTPTMIRTHVG
ncbi:MAG TPA: hypothetical protein VM783_09665 [Candidatus Acidoferrum sp.]|nr:hypothetical protein [Candidatus Acidoferrum sp.]